MEDKAMCNSAISKYIRRTKRIYYGDRELKKRFIKDLQDSLICYSEEHPDCSYTDLVDTFGSPYEIRESFLETFPKELKKRDIILYRVVISFSVLIVIAVLTFTAYYVKKNYDYSQGYAVKSIKDKEHSELNSEPKPTPITVFKFD